LFIALATVLATSLAPTAQAVVINRFEFAPNAISPLQDKEAKPKVVFSADLEKRFAEFIDKLTEAKRKLWTERMKREIEEVQTVTGLDAAGAQALEAPAQEAREKCLKDWSGKMSDIFRGQYGAFPKQLVRMFLQMEPQVDSVVKQGWNSVSPPPVDHQIWLDALQRVLTPQQSATWEKRQAERKATLQVEIKEFLKPSREIIHQQQNGPITAKATYIKITLGLDAKRAAKLDDFVSAAVDKAVDAWQDRAEKILLAGDDAQRRQMMKVGRFYTGLEDNELPQSQPAWNEGLAGLLTAEELARLDSAREARKTRLIHALTPLLVTELDDRVAFTASQRERLLPLAERLVQTVPTLFSDQGFTSYYFSARHDLLEAAARAPAPEVQAILDAAQWEHWRAACAPEESDLEEEDAPPELTAEIAPPEPEDFERGVSDFLFERSEKRKKQFHEQMVLMAEDATRTAGLSAEVGHRLRIAALGAAEASLAAWKPELEQTVRSSLTDMTARNVKQRLAGLENLQFQRSGETSATHQPVWERTLQSDLTEAQRAAWQKEVDQRRAYHDQAIVSSVMAEFDRKVILRPEQWEKLEPLVSEIIKEYGPELGSFFANPDGSRWYLLSHSRLLPFAGVPEAQLNSILTREQLESWTASNEFSNAANYWNILRQNHQQMARPRR
jgi:hypothetical protein